MNPLASPTPALTATLVELGAWLKSTSYTFVTPTPATHKRVIQRRTGSRSRSFRDAFGWSLPFTRDLIPAHVFALMQGAFLLQDASQVQDALHVQDQGNCFISRVRFSSLGEDLYAHSAYPTDTPDSIFFGPDTYRFAALINAELERVPLPTSGRILDIGCGAGPGGIVAAKATDGLMPSLILCDINSAALEFASANAALAGIDASFAVGDLFAPVSGEFDLIVSNPPYLNDHAARTYRHGGGRWGGALSERIVREGVKRLAPSGRLVLYTGVAIVDGGDPFIESLRSELNALGWPWTYRELDPDVFGEELEEEAYAGAERIAAVALIVTRPGA